MGEENASISSRDVPRSRRSNPLPRHQDTFHFVYVGEHVERARARLSNLGKLQVKAPL
jgi:hypothetical protein